MRSRSELLLPLACLLALSLPVAAAAEAPEVPLDQGRGTGRPAPIRLPQTIVPTPAPGDDLRSRLDRSPVPLRAQYFTHPEDVSVQGSHCVGLDCTGSESFGFDTIRLKENNVRIKFEDTSVSAGFPFKDWSLVANESATGGLNMFSLENNTDSRVPFLVRDDAPTNALYLSGNRVGLGTASPALKIHAIEYDTPALRLDQPLLVYPAYVWDVAGNESNFFVRDGITGSLPFRIMPGSAGDALVTAAAGVGIGTSAPGARLHLSHAAPTLLVTNQTSTTNTLSLDTAGNLTLSGLLFESSSRGAKENLTPVDPDALLDRVNQLPIYEWNYRAEDPSVTHVGPVAEDFAAAFGLGRDDRHIASLDASGVALGAIQALERGNRARDARIATLEAQLAAQAAELERLAGQLRAILDRNGSR